MIKRIIINLIAIIITIIVMIFGYYMIMDIETKIPQKANESCDIDTKEFMSRKIFDIALMIRKVIRLVCPYCNNEMESGMIVISATGSVPCAIIEWYSE